jgi:ATP synthase protein I
MTDTSSKPLGGPQPSLAQTVGTKVARKLKARRNAPAGVWYGLGVIGLIGQIGWSVAVPALFGAALGSWLDRHYPGGRSWTLLLLMAGWVIGCFKASHWVDWEDSVDGEERALREEADDDEDGDFLGNRE